MMASFKNDYPWTSSPLVASAPMRLISKARLAVAVSNAGGLGFLASGTDTTALEADLEEVVRLLRRKNTDQTTQTLPIGVGFINWGSNLPTALKAIQRFQPAAVWLFAPRDNSDLLEWATQIRSVSPATKIWIQVGTVHEAVTITNIAKPDVLVVQGLDAGGHGLNRGASLISLLPEVADALVSKLPKGQSVPNLVAAGGIADARGTAAALALGADGVVMGTRYLCSHEAEIANGYQQALIKSEDGGVHTVRSTVYDILRGTTGWPSIYGGRGVVNASYEDAVAGMREEENKKMYENALKLGDGGWGPKGRLTTYAGTAVGLVRDVRGAADITTEVRVGCRKVIKKTTMEIKSL